MASSAEAIARADLMVAQFLARQRVVSPVIGATDLITAIAAALDDLALPLAALLEGLDGSEGRDNPEAFLARVNAARAALWRFKGRPAGRIG